MNKRENQQPAASVSPPAELLPAHKLHPRQFQGTSLVYPVISRRSRGFSVGINLSPSQQCNFNCLYCQIHRQRPVSSTPALVPPPNPAFSGQLLEKELTMVLETILAGEIFQYDPFQDVPPHLRRLNDIAFSGDGEPTASPNFLETVRLCARIKDQMALTSVKLLLITNSTLLGEPQVVEGLRVLDRHQGEIWAKLDAGTEAYYQEVNRGSIPFAEILDNLRAAGRRRPIIIQTLFMKIDGRPPADAEIDAYISRLNDLRAAGTQISAIHLHTVARPPADIRAGALAPDELGRLAQRIAERVALPVQKY